LTAPI